ncbi:alpha/beta hydrolase [Rubritalea spongiae]|uniref:Alpha/beta hydrolase n=1 Tax=Rubritalea spongiae TaxID=430797 RepID=A0ABW5E871_9BACT
MSLVIYSMGRAQEHEVIDLWPSEVPGQSESKAPVVFSEDTRGNVTRIAKVTKPVLVVYEPASALKNGAAVIICPGGGYNILAIDLEGYEVAEWLSGLGYTAFVLQYRVPQNRAGALQDAQRAIRYVRGISEERGIDPNKVGILGFSAGGSLSARASTRYLEDSYAAVDALDKLSARPDFTALIYPAYLDQGPDRSLSPELRLSDETAPMFLFVAADDRFANSCLVMSSALQLQKVPFELHVLAHGGHGFGMRSGNHAAETWPKLCEEWLNVTVLKK